MGFNGLGMNLGNLSRLSDAKSRSISAENRNGEPGRGGMAGEEGASWEAAKDLGVGWKTSPCVKIAAGETFPLADIEGPGAIQQIWMTPTEGWRFLILRIYWDGQEYPSVECPIGDFFACGWEQYSQLSSLAVCCNPRSGLNCYWEMPFRRRCRMTVENLNPKEATLFYQINYTLTEIPEDCAYFHASFRRVNPLPYKEVYTVLDGVEGKGHYVGTYLAWGVNNACWWGEGEIKFYLDGDTEYPTICGTGTEDYFCGSYNFENPHTHKNYVEFSTPYGGFYKVGMDALYQSQNRFGAYRFHINDPIRFEEDLKVTIQALGWREGGRYLPLQDDISSVAFWYQDLPTAEFPKLKDKDYLEVI